jgi:hypothetical protein
MSTTQRMKTLEPRPRIDELTRMLIAPEGGDLPALTAELGLAWLEVYETEGDEDALVAGMSCLRHCIDTAPEHADRARWTRWLGLGQGERARRTGAIDDYHQAIELMAALYASPLPGPELRPQIAATLVGLGWERLWLRRSEDDDATFRPADLIAVDRLIAMMAPLLTGAADPDGVPWVRQVVGLAHLERYELAGERADLDRGVDLLAAGSVWDLTAGTALVGRIGSELAYALRRVGLLDADETRLDQALAAGWRTLQHADPHDDDVLQLLHLYQAYAHEARWLVVGETKDLGGALASWQVLLGDDELTLAQAFGRLDPGLPPTT